MNNNPLFPSPDADSRPQLPDNTGAPMTPPADDKNAAADLIRHKLAQIYADEPNAKQELAEAAVVKPRSKHQQFMHELANSGKSLADIQTEWHNYYVNLPDGEKHQVWQEFYESSSSLGKYHQHAAAAPAAAPTTEQLAGGVVASKSEPAPEPVRKPRALAIHPAKRRPTSRASQSRADIKKRILDQVSAGGRLKARHHLQSLLFGLSLGFVVIVIFLFGFFNQVIIAPFIQPSRTASATPLILSTSDISPTSQPEVIIPKINVEIPVDYSETTTDEAAIENDLEHGVVHYPTTVVPGQKGNAAFFGHSSNNIFNPGKYKFAFVLLHTLVKGDTFYLTYNGKVYVYRVISRQIVDPSDVAVLGPVAGQTATATLITCDPPGTSLHRLVVVGQQISPDPSGNTASTASLHGQMAPPANLPGNGPSLWSRFVGWLEFWN